MAITDITFSIDDKMMNELHESFGISKELLFHNSSYVRSNWLKYNGFKQVRVHVCNDTERKELIDLVMRKFHPRVMISNREFTFVAKVWFINDYDITLFLLASPGKIDVIESTEYRYVED